MCFGVCVCISHSLSMRAHYLLINSVLGQGVAVCRILGISAGTPTAPHPPKTGLSVESRAKSLSFALHFYTAYATGPIWNFLLVHIQSHVDMSSLRCKVLRVVITIISY